MRIEPLGDKAYILRDLDEPAYLIAKAINAKPPRGVVEAVASYETVALYVDSEIGDAENLFLTAAKGVEPARHVIPVCYELGDDLDTVAERLGLAREALIAAHTSVEYRCYALGFCPGFAYLGYLPDSLAGLPRLETPRLRVEPGSVAITGRQTAVYPLERPGGWWLIGRTPLELVGEDYYPIEAGDLVSFTSISLAEYEARKGERL